jgi:hypothetical protein
MAEFGSQPMLNLDHSADVYSEQEIADRLGISVSRLHDLLDRHIFNNGTTRPGGLTFTHSELVLLEFWLRGEPNPKVLRMPRRN